MSAPVAASCSGTVGQQGSVAWADLTFPTGTSSVLLVQVTTTATGQNANSGFFVRPSRLTRAWGMARIHSPTTASFYIGAPGQFSVEARGQRAEPAAHALSRGRCSLLPLLPAARCPLLLTLLC
jgi:hypothetical protein